MSKAASWGLSFTFLKGDVRRAFDCISHEHLEEALEYVDCPARLQCAIFRELSESSINLLFQGATFEPIPFEKGGRQGGCDTPDLWNYLLNLCVCRAKARWRVAKLGIRLSLDDFQSEYGAVLRGAVGDPAHPHFGPEDYLEEGFYTLYCMIWADDLLLLAEDEEAAHAMWIILSEELARVGLVWKSGSLQLLVAGFEPEENKRFK